MKDNTTELEQHLVDHYRDTEDGFIDGIETKKDHFLSEFVDGYTRAPDAYASTPEELALLNDFLRIANADIEGSYEYNSNDFINIVVKALDTFGL